MQARILVLALLLAVGCAWAEAPKVPWRAVGWDGRLWAKDLAREFPITERPEGGWLLANQYGDWPASLAVLENWDIRNGPIEIELNVLSGRCRVGVGSAMGKDAHWSILDISSGRAVKVTLALLSGRPAAAVDDQAVLVTHFNSVKDITRPYLSLHAAARVEVLSVRQLALTAPLAWADSVPPSDRPVQDMPAAWRTRGWNDSLWIKDVSADLHVQRQPDNSWRITNNYAQWSSSQVILENLDVRKGPVEMAVRASQERCTIGIASASGTDAHVEVPIYEVGEWVTIRIGMEGARGVAWVRGRPEQVRHFRSAPDLYRPYLSLPVGASIEVRCIGQAKR